MSYWLLARVVRSSGYDYLHSQSLWGTATCISFRLQSNLLTEDGSIAFLELRARAVLYSSHAREPGKLLVAKCSYAHFQLGRVSLLACGCLVRLRYIVLAHESLAEGDCRCGCSQVIAQQESAAPQQQHCTQDRTCTTCPHGHSFPYDLCSPARGAVPLGSNKTIRFGEGSCTCAKCMRNTSPSCIEGRYVG